MRYIPKFRSFFTLFSLVGVALVLVGCNEQDAATVKAAADAASTSLNPLTAGVGIIVSAFASHFISKANDGVADRKDWSKDDVSSMIREIEAMGYIIQKKT